MTDEVTITVKMPQKFKKWQVPSYATALNNEDQAKPTGTSMAVSKLDVAALDALAEAWLNDLYMKAHNRNPWRKAQYR